MLTLLIDTTSPTQDGILDSFLSPGRGIEQDFVKNDVALALTIRPVVPSITSVRPWDDDNISTDTYQVAIGNRNAQPTSGQWPLTIGSQTVSGIDSQVTAATLQTSLSAASVTAGYGALTVALLSAGVFQVTWTTNGAVPTMTSGTSSLLPASNVTITVEAAGSGSAQAVQIVVLQQAPVAYCEPSTELPAAAIAATIAQAGSGSANKIYALTMTAGTYGGTFSLTLTTIASVVTSFIFSGTISANDLSIALNAANGITNGDIACSRTGDVLNIQFQGTQKLSNSPLIAVTNIDLLAPKGVSGVLNLNTVNLFLAFCATTANTITYTFSIRRTRATGEQAEFFIHDVTLKRNLIDASTMVPITAALYYTAAQSLLYLLNSGTALGITSLTAGDATDLNSIVVSDTMRGRSIAVDDSTYGYGIWELFNSTAADSAATGYRRPANYDGTTNHNVWIRRT